VIGALTACVAFVVDVAVATVSDWKQGYCTRNPFLNIEGCCAGKTPLLSAAEFELVEEYCDAWHAWSPSYVRSFGIYVGLALIFGTISSSATMTTKSSLPSVSPPVGQSLAPQIKINGLTEDTPPAIPTPSTGGKIMYMASGSGIPEIKVNSTMHLLYWRHTLTSYLYALRLSSLASTFHPFSPSACSL
jgi:chloride channel 3/4/5